MGGRDGVDDDFELEVSDLRRAPSAETPHAGQWAGALDGSTQAGAHDRGTAPDALGIADAAQASLAPAEVDRTSMAGTIEPTAWHLAARLFAARRTHRYAVAVLVVLVCAGLLLSLPSTRQALRQALVRPTPTATVPLAAGADQVYFVQTAPWGHLKLDGTPVASTFGQSLSLPRGQHTLTYTAAPWPLLRCQLSVPEQLDDSCPVDSNMHFGNTPLARAIDLGATADRLPEAPLAALTAVVARALQMDVETTAVPPGDHYRAADGRIDVARLALQASLVLALNFDATRVASNTVAPESGGVAPISWTGYFMRPPMSTW